MYLLGHRGHFDFTFGKGRKPFGFHRVGAPSLGYGFGFEGSGFQNPYIPELPSLSFSLFLSLSGSVFMPPNMGLGLGKVLVNSGKPMWC